MWYNNNVRYSRHAPPSQQRRVAEEVGIETLRHQFPQSHYAPRKRSAHLTIIIKLNYMSDTNIKWCDNCGIQFDYLPSAGLPLLCDECIEKDSEPPTDHYEETVQHRELNSGLI